MNLPPPITSLKEPANVFIYDWKTGAHLDNFKMAASNTRSFGAYLGEMIDFINIEYDIPTDKMWCIGFGLGAHLCSLAVDQVQQRISRITGEGVGLKGWSVKDVMLF